MAGEGDLWEQSYKLENQNNELKGTEKFAFILLKSFAAMSSDVLVWPVAYGG